MLPRRSPRLPNLRGQRLGSVPARRRSGAPPGNRPEVVAVVGIDDHSQDTIEAPVRGEPGGPGRRNSHMDDRELADCGFLARMGGERRHGPRRGGSVSPRPRLPRRNGDSGWHPAGHWPPTSAQRPPAASSPARLARRHLGRPWAPGPAAERGQKEMSCLFPRGTPVASRRMSERSELVI